MSALALAFFCLSESGRFNGSLWPPAGAAPASDAGDAGVSAGFADLSAGAGVEAAGVDAASGLGEAAVAAGLEELSAGAGAAVWAADHATVIETIRINENKGRETLHFM